MDVFGMILIVIWFAMIWFDIIEVRIGLSWFVVSVAWCLLVWFGVILTFFVIIDVLLSDLGGIWF